MHMTDMHLPISVGLGDRLSASVPEAEMSVPTGWRGWPVGAVVSSVPRDGNALAGNRRKGRARGTPRPGLGGLQVAPAPGVSWGPLLCLAAIYHDLGRTKGLVGGPVPSQRCPHQHFVGNGPAMCSHDPDAYPFGGEKGERYSAYDNTTARFRQHGGRRPHLGAPIPWDRACTYSPLRACP